ncbi:RNA 2',3'-cyclic phosphodiesterase [Nocardioides aestuarii]
MFVAMVPPAEAVEDLDAFLDVRRAAAPFRWTQPDQLHVTLAFLAAVPDRSLDDLVERLAAAARRRTPVTARIAGGGAFPHPDAAKVVWAGLRTTGTDHAELVRMSDGARRAANASGIAPDGQRFRPHLTVARTGRPRQVTRWVQLLDGYEGPSWRVGEWSLVASHLGEGPARRPRYEEVARVQVG